MRIIYYPTQPPFYGSFPLRKSGRCCRRGWGCSPFKVVFPCGKKEVLSITVYPIPFFALFTEQGLPFPLATCVTAQAYTACQLAAYNKSRPEAAFNVMFYATSHLYFSTLYRGTKGISMGTVFTYC